MRKTTRGRNVQHVAPQAQREVTRLKKGLFGQMVKSTYTVKAHGGFCIKHAPQRHEMKSSPNAAYVNWKDTDGARRRGWS